jgi:oligo-1,6-glucosidase
VNPNYTEINLAAQREDPDSVWNFYRELIALRNDPAYREVVVYGALEPYMPEQTNLMAYFRRSAEQTLLVLGNYQNTPQRAALPGTIRTVLINNLHTLQQDDGSVCLEPWQFVVLELEDRS